MESEEKAGLAARRCEEVAQLARGYLNHPGFSGLNEIDIRISEAMADSRWDDMSKWHRVKFRLLRLKQQHAMSEAIGGACGPLALAAGK